MRRLLIRPPLIALGAIALLGTGCRREAAPSARGSGYEAFVPVYNRHIAKWLKEQQELTAREVARIDGELANAQGTARELLTVRAAALRHDQEKWRFRIALGDYLKTGTPADIPADLVWENGMDQPDIGDPAATKGGVFRKNIPSFPPTIRPFGDNSNHSFRGDLYDYIEMPLVIFHPDTMEMIPGVARQWAVSRDGRTIYFRIDPEARYSDGVPVHARDFQVAIYLRASDHIINPYSKQYFRESMAQVAVYDDHTLSVSLPEAKIYAPALAGSVTPSPPHFYAEYGSDYSERYQWKFPPTAGAYEVLPQDIIKGVSITQTRVRNWWARDRKYYRYRFNPDKIVSTVVRDESKAFELFRAGELDTFYLTRPELWYEKCEIDPVYKGYIERVTFYTRYPKIPRGIYMNVSKPPLNDRNVRIGIQYALNWQKVIDVMFRGDYQRLNAFNEGYVNFSDPSIKARPYSIDLARQSFRAAGYTVEGTDGILAKPGGGRLSVAVTYSTALPMFDRMFAILREEAKACGFDLRLDGLEDTVAYKKEMQKQHELTLGSWLITPPVPDFHEFLHSSNAFDEKGNPKTQTNNTFVWARPDTDLLCDQVRTGRTMEEIRDATWKLQRIMHDEAIFVPSYAVDFMRIGSWRWVRWPDSETTRYSPPVVFDPHEVYVLWIDEKIRAETQAARRTGKAFPESTKTVDAYRLTAEPTPPANPSVPMPKDAPRQP
jgi:microcin C transport system substrate-binding protein